MDNYIEQFMGDGREYQKLMGQNMTGLNTRNRRVSIHF
jgi:hypothetical protein